MKQAFKDYWKKKIDFLDIHYHVSPDVYLRKHNVVEAGGIYKKLGGGVILKNHLGDSVSLAEVAQELSLPVFGSIVLNQIAGGVSIGSLLESLCKTKSDVNGRLLTHPSDLSKNIT